MSPIYIIVFGGWIIASSVFVSVVLVMRHCGFWSFIFPNGRKGTPTQQFKADRPYLMMILNAIFSLGCGVVAAGVIVAAYSLIVEYAP
jgi:hypothetical protein